MSAIQGKVRAARNPLYTIATYRNRIPANIAPAFAQWVFRSYGVFGNLRGVFPKQLSDFYSGIHFPAESLEKELMWLEATFEANADSLTQFLEISGEVNTSVLEGDLDHTIKRIEETEKCISLSFWGISNKISCEQFIDNSSVRTFSIKDDKAASPILKFLVSMWETRSDLDVSPTWFNSHAQNTLSNIPRNDGFQEFLLYQLTGQLPPVEMEAEFLSVLNSISIIDAYEAYVELALHSMAWERTSSHTFQKSIKNTLSFLEDSRLQRALFVEQKQNTFAVPETVASSNTINIETFQLSVSDRFQLSYPKNASWNRIGTEILSQIRLLEERNSKNSSAMMELVRKSFLFSQMDMGKWLGNMIFCSWSPDPSSDEARQKSAFFYSRGIDPAFAKFAPEKREFVELVPLKYQKCNFFKYYSALFDDRNIQSGEFPPEVLEEIEVLRLFYAQEFREAHIRACKCIERFGDDASHEIPSVEVMSLCEAGEFKQAVSRVVEYCLSNEMWIRLLPLEYLDDLIDKKIRKSLSADIQLSILYEILNSNYNLSKESELANCCDDFLILNGYEKPSDLMSSEADYKREHLVYFLKNVCKSEALQISIAYENLDDVFYERGLICQWLIELDPDNAPEYEDELLEIMKNNHIKKAIDQIEQSKIYVDETEIRKWAKDALFGDFERYKQLLSEGLGFVEDEFLENLLDYISGEKTESTRIIYLTQNEASELFTRILSRFYDEVYQNQEHGLDCYLSMRIRHGTLSGQIRSALESDNLLTHKDGYTGKYQTNTHWLNELAARVKTDHSYKDVDTILRDFSSDFDNKIDHITSELIQVRRSEKPQGLIVPTIPRELVKAIAAEVSENTEFEDFLDSCFEVFWVLVERDLTLIKHHIDEHIEKEMMDVILGFENKIENVVDHSNLGDFRDALKRGRSNLHIALEKMKSWFNKPKSTSAIEFLAEDLIDIGLKTVQALHRDFQPEVVINETDPIPLANALNPFSDIFFIVFGNIFKHSGNDMMPKVNISVSYFDDNIFIRIENNCGSGINKAVSEEKLASIRQRIEDGEYKEAISQEGGSGLLKLRKLVGDHEVGRPLEFGFVEDLFYVEFSLKLRSFTK